MRRNITIKTLLLLSLFVTGSAWAEWVKVAETDRVIFYIDPATLRKEGDLRKIWVIQDYKTRMTDGQMSARMRSEFDCKNERSRILTSTTHPESMAAGLALFTMRVGSGEWSDVPPNGASEVVLKIVCTR